MKYIFLIAISVIYFACCYIFFLKKWYELLAISKVYIPDFISSRDFFINDKPLNILKNRRNTIIILIIVTIFLIAIFFNNATFYLTLASLVSSFFTSLFTFNARIFENKIFSIFSNYLSNEFDFKPEE